MYAFQRSLLQSTASSNPMTGSNFATTETGPPGITFPIWIIPLVPFVFLLVYGIIVVVVAHKRQQSNIRIIPQLTRTGYTRQSIQVGSSSSSPPTETEIELQDALNKVHRLKGQEQNLNKQISTITKQVVKARTQAEKSKNDLAHEKRLREKAESLIDGARQQAKKEIYARLNIEADRREVAHKLSTLKQKNEQLNKDITACKEENKEKNTQIEQLQKELKNSKEAYCKIEEQLEESKTEAYDHYLNAENEKQMRLGMETELKDVLESLDKVPEVSIEVEYDLNSPITEEMNNVLTSRDWQVQLIKAETIRTACQIFFIKYRPFQKVTREQVTKRFLKLSHLLHPDKNMDFEESIRKVREERFAYLSRAKALSLAWIEEDK